LALVIHAPVYAVAPVVTIGRCAIRFSIEPGIDAITLVIQPILDPVAFGIQALLYAIAFPVQAVFYSITGISLDHHGRCQ
jgi:hypothetical protein